MSYADKWTAAAGALYNLIVGLAFYILFRQTPRLSSHLRYFLWLLAALNMFDLPSYMAFSAITKQGDWEVVLHGLPHEAIIRSVMASLATLAYVMMIRAIAAGLAIFAGRLWKLSLTPYVVAIAISV